MGKVEKVMLVVVAVAALVATALMVRDAVSCFKRGGQPVNGTLWIVCVKEARDV